jgi:hypothetical protein
MTQPLILDRRAKPPARIVRPLPEHRYDPDVGANVTLGGTLLVRAADPRLVADYTGTQDQSGIHKDD